MTMPLSASIPAIRNWGEQWLGWYPDLETIPSACRAMQHANIQHGAETLTIEQMCDAIAIRAAGGSAAAPNIECANSAAILKSLLDSSYLTSSQAVFQTTVTRGIASYSNDPPTTSMLHSDHVFCSVWYPALGHCVMQDADYGFELIDASSGELRPVEALAAL
jgi:hypothetical protein